MRSSWLARVVDSSLADSILGDLQEERGRRAQSSRAGATVWFWRAALGVAWYGLSRRAVTYGGEIVTRPFRASGLGADVRYTGRALRHAPWYAATVVGVIAVGMTLATTVFSIVDVVLFKPLPYPDAGRIFAVVPQGQGISLADLETWAITVPEASFTGFSAGYSIGFGEKANEGPSGIAQVQRNFFDVIRVRPLVGGFAPGDFDVDSRVWPAIITYQLWQGHFHGDPDVVGRVVIDDSARDNGYRIVGIMPPEFLFPSRIQVTLITPMIASDRGLGGPLAGGFLEVIARVPRTLTAAAFHARLDAGLATVAVRPLGAVMDQQLRPLFDAIFWAVLVLVALAAVNTSGLMAARCLDRSHDLGLRRALGAGGLGIARLVILEALVLISAGSSIALAVAPSALRLAVGLLPRDATLPMVPAINWRVAGFVVISGLLLAMLTTIWPIARALRLCAASLTNRRQTRERTRSVGRSVVVSLQIAGAYMLSVVGALLVGSLLAVYAHASAIETSGVINERVLVSGPGGTAWKSPEKNVRVDGLVRALHGLPGVESVAVTSGQILRGDGWTTWFRAPAGITNPHGVRVDVAVQAVTSEFYRVVRPQLVLGRLPTDEELASDSPVIVITEGLAHAFWPDHSAIGQALVYLANPEPLRVVGVVRDVRLWTLDDNVVSIYGPYSRLSRSLVLSIYVRPSAGAGDLLTHVTQAIERADPSMHVVGGETLDEALLDSVRLRRLQSWLFGSFAAAALTVLCIGVLGLTSMAMARETREIGIRTALGANPSKVVSLFLREQLTAVALGLVAGGLAAGWAVRLLTSSLYELTAYDPRIWVLAALTIVATATIGTLIPSLRASRVDPVQALRGD